MSGLDTIRRAAADCSRIAGHFVGCDCGRSVLPACDCGQPAAFVSFMPPYLKGTLGHFLGMRGAALSHCGRCVHDLRGDVFFVPAPRAVRS